MSGIGSAAYPGRDRFTVMDFAYTPEDEAFRTELREWLEKNIAAFDEQPIPEVPGMTKLYAKRQAWQKVMAAGG